MKEIYDKLREDEHYYGEFGKQFLSNSDISVLLKNPRDLHKPKPSSPALLVGGDMQQKGMQTAQQFGAASTYAKKYALGNLLLIDDTEDADATNSHGKGPAAKAVTKTKITKEQMTKAIDFVKNGGSVEAIKKKYTLTDAQIKQLA